MKRKLFVSLAAASVLGGVSLGTTQAFAATFPKTDVTIGFKGDQNPNPNPDPTGLSLELLSVPSRFDFGKTNSAGDVVQVNYTNTNATYVALRDGNETQTDPWSLTASMSELVQTQDPTKKMPAELTIETEGKLLDFDYTPGQAVPTPDATTTHDNSANATLASFASANKTKVVTGGTEAFIVKGTHKNDSNYAVKIKNASIDIAKDDARYEYAGKEFTGTVTWALSVTP